MRKPLLGCLAILLWSVAAPAAAGTYGVDVAGYLDGEFQAYQQNDGSETQTKSSFGDYSHVLFRASAQPSEEVSFLSEVWYWQSSNTVTLQQATIDWRLLHREKGDWGLRFGKFYFPFGIEMQSVYATSNKLVSRPYWTSWADNGVSFHGQLAGIGGSQVGMGYDLAVANGLEGTALAPQLVDLNNNTKSVGARIRVMPVEKLDIGGSGVWGKWDEDGDNNYLLLGAHAVVGMLENLDVRGEFVTAMFDKGLVTEDGVKDLTKLTTYGQVAYRLHPSSMEFAELAARFGYTDPDTDTSDDQLMQLAVGGSISPAEHLQFKGEFQLNLEGDAYKVGGETPDNNALRLQAIFGW